MHSPCSTRSASSVPNEGARGTSADGTTISALAATSEARRPIRSESGPQNQPPSATAAITAEMLSPARAGETPNSRPSSGRIAWVEYMTANIAPAASRNGAIARSAARSLTSPARASRAGLVARTAPSAAEPAATSTATCQLVASDSAPEAAAPNAIPPTSAVSGQV